MTTRTCLIPVAALFALTANGCVVEEAAQSEDRCAEVIEQMAECYPDLAQEAQCTPQTIEQFDSLDLGSRSCETLDELGKADTFALGGCGAGQHVCGWIFCCDDYSLNWTPRSTEDWNVVPVVQQLWSETPASAIADLDSASYAELRSGVSTSYVQSVAEYVGGGRQQMAVELTRIAIDVPYAEFVQRLAPQHWGISLDHYLGGEVAVYQTDGYGRATYQLERMVLSPFPCNMESVLSNNDMTKVEAIGYGADYATVYWRVMYSENNSTATDVGSVSFMSWGSQTLVIFQSAHRLNMPGGIPIPSAVLAPALEKTFLDFVRHYKAIVE